MDEVSYFDDFHARQRAVWPAGLPTEPVYPHGEIALADYLRIWARRCPDRVAIYFYGRTLSFAELDDLSERCAALLAQHGVAAGDRVAVMLGNCPQFHIAFYAILKLGAVYVPVNPLFREEELAYELDDADPTCAIVLDQLAPLLLSVRPKTRIRTVFSTGQGEMLPPVPEFPLPPGLGHDVRTVDGTVNLLPAIRACTARLSAVHPDLDAVAALNYTGGTTGLPKGCIHTQRDMIYTAATTYATSGAVDRGGQPLSDEPEVLLSFLPMFWIAGENLGLLYPIFSGATLVLLARWDPAAVLQAVERCRVTRTFMVVDNVLELMAHPDLARHDLRSLQHTRTASFVRKLNLDIRRRWFDLTGGTIAEGAWGMTETHTSDTFTVGMQTDDLDLRGRPIFVGLPMPGTRIKICDFDSGALLPVGEEGEIVVSTPSLFKGYWRQPDASDRALRDGWFHTGDIGAYDADGYLHFLGRRKEMLKVRGMSVFPPELEVMLSRHEAVLGSAVVGRPDADRGQVPVAFVRLRPEFQGRVDADALQAWCREHMAIYKVPEVRIVGELPMTATGKIRKVELQTELEAQIRISPAPGLPL